MNELERLVPAAQRLSVASRRNRYDVRRLFEWPENLPTDSHWISPELSSCYPTHYWEELDRAGQVRLTQCELINFFSVNVEFIRKLIGEVTARIYTTRFRDLSEFLYDFLAEENDHMWMFATFCWRFAGKVYGSRSVSPEPRPRSVASDLLVFGRILVAEEFCDEYNKRLAADERLPQLVRRINLVHHQDESRHIAFGRQLLEALCEEVSLDERMQVGSYLARYIDVFTSTLYNAAVYRDAGMAQPMKVRQVARVQSHLTQGGGSLTGRTIDFLGDLGLYRPPSGAGTGR